MSSGDGSRVIGSVYSFKRKKERKKKALDERRPRRRLGSKKSLRKKDTSDSLIRRKSLSWVWGQTCWISVRWSLRWCWNGAEWKRGRGARRCRFGAVGTRFPLRCRATGGRRTPATTSESHISPCRSVGYIKINNIQILFHSFSDLKKDTHQSI